MHTEGLSHNRFDVYRTVTNSIVAAIEAGAGEFTMPWHGQGAAIAKPQNAHTGMEYHGINVLALWAQAQTQGYRSGYWATYRQWQELGAQVLQGEKSSTIVFFKRSESEPDGKEPTMRLFARASRVFNADQVQGWTPPEERHPPGDAEITEALAQFVSGTKPKVDWDGRMACYHIPTDHIELPAIARFRDTPTSSATQAYGSTLLHELVHWSGARHRLDRFGGRLKAEDVAIEELVAELGSAFLCADLALASVPRPDHAAYVAHWLQLLKSDTRAIFAASRLANQAATFLHELVLASG